MALFRERKLVDSTWKKQFGSLESGLWKICIGAPILAVRTRQTRAFAQTVPQLLKKTADFKTLPNSLYSRRSRYSSPSSSSSSSDASKKGFLDWYLGKLHSNPLVTKSVSTSIIFTLADVTTQFITMPPDGSLDGIRMLRMSSYGLLIMGPSQHCWFNFLSKIMPQTSLCTTFTKIFMGQAIFGPCINSIFFSYNAGLQGESQEQIVARLKRDLLPTLKNGLMYWPLCDFVTFTFVPVHLQFICLLVDYLFDIHGKLTESGCIGLNSSSALQSVEDALVRYLQQCFSVAGPI
ncbi:hypothetical protein V2J09_007124 [Rumex salicifolius]